MKYIVCALLAVAMIALCHAAEGERGQDEGKSGDLIYWCEVAGVGVEWTVQKEQIMAGPHWAPVKGKPPVPAERAYAIARAGLPKRLKAVEAWECYAIQLIRHDDELWYWEVCLFDPINHDGHSGPMTIPVYLSGTVGKVRFTEGAN